jgi:hypothetical protein
MAQLLLYQQEVPGLLGQLNCRRAWGKPEGAQAWRAKLPQTEVVEECHVTPKRPQFIAL